MPNGRGAAAPEAAPAAEQQPNGAAAAPEAAPSGRSGGADESGADGRAAPSSGPSRNTEEVMVDRLMADGDVVGAMLS
jgi:hypothetical protein